jgi:hypothetical protein
MRLISEKNKSQKNSRQIGSEAARRTTNSGIATRLSCPARHCPFCFHRERGSRVEADAAGQMFPRRRRLLSRKTTLVVEAVAENCHQSSADCDNRGLLHTSRYDPSPA